MREYKEQHILDLGNNDYAKICIYSAATEYDSTDDIGEKPSGKKQEVDMNSIILGNDLQK